MAIDVLLPCPDGPNVFDREGMSWRSRTLSEILLSEVLSRDLLEESRWPIGPVCVKCGAFGKGCRVTSRTGLWSCKACRNCQYSVTCGTALHGTRVELFKWIKLFSIRYIWQQPMTGISLSRNLSISYLTARRMMLKIEELERDMPAMTERLKVNIRAVSQGCFERPV